MDALFIFLTHGFFALSAGLVRLSDKLMRS